MFDIIIIGAGAAGMTAALNSLRNGKTVLILESETIGGQISLSPRVENIPSIKEISGAEFSDKLFDQILSLGVCFELEKVTNITQKNNYFKVTTEYNSYDGKAVIIATGVKPKKINIDKEDELTGHGISYCALCDGAFYKDEDICLIGDGNTALQYSLLLSNYARKLYICTLFDKFFGDYALIERLKEKNNVTIIHNISLKEFKEENGSLTGAVFENTITKELLNLNAKACFIAIGQVPDNKKFENLVNLSSDGYIETDQDMQTKTNGVFACGDCRVKKVRQVTTAVNDGAIASLSASLFLEKIAK